MKTIGALGLALGMIAWAAPASSQTTDFGVRTLSGSTQSRSDAAVDGAPPAHLNEFAGLAAAASLGARWGRVTSTLRSSAHNRAVGGVRNSWHLRGRAMDIARRPGVSHQQIAAALRHAGFNLIESLDEGDHSHFAFGGGATTFARAVKQASESTHWGIVTVASLRGN